MSLILVDGIKDRPGTGGPKFPNGLHLPAGIGITGDGHINMAGVCTFSGNVTIGGTLTYEDVTNIDSVGIITANTGINVVANGINVQAGILTAKNIIDASDAQRNTRVGSNAGNSFDGTTATQNSLIGYWPFCGNTLNSLDGGLDATANGAILTTDRFGEDNLIKSFESLCKKDLTAKEILDRIFKILDNFAGTN